MSGFDRNLGLLGLGIEGDLPGPGTDTFLPDGIHLRWQFKRERGFPWHGYYLLRRSAASGWKSAFDFKHTFRHPNYPKSGNALQTLLNSFSNENQDAVYVPLKSPDTASVVVGAADAKAKVFFQKVGTATELPSGRVTIDSPIGGTSLIDFPLLTGQPPEGGSNHYDLYGLSLNKAVSLQLQAPPPHRYRRVRLRIGFLQAGTITVFASMAGQTIMQQSVTGSAGSTKTLALHSDDQPFSVLSFSRADAVVLDLELVFAIGSEAWDLVPFNTLKEPQPIRLPLTHPDYPAGQGEEDIRRARDLASARSFVRVDSFPWRVPAHNVPAVGTVTVMPNSPFVQGAGTGWDDSIEGHVLEIDQDRTPQTIMRVLDPERLVLARAYTGPWRTQIGYTINPDPFGQLYDALGLLVEGGPAAGSMANRFLRPKYHPGGTAAVSFGSTHVTGQGTSWSLALAGLDIHCLQGQGTLRFTPGSNVVEGIGTRWRDTRLFPSASSFFGGLPGTLLEIDGHPRPYLVTHVVGDHHLRIHPPAAVGEHEDDRPQSANFRILDRQPYRIKQVATATSLHLDRSYREPSRKTEYVLRIPKSRGETPLEESDVEVQVPDQRLLDVIALGGLSPMIAQTLGLQVMDYPPKTNASGALLAYDYLLIADHEGFFQHRSVASWVNSESGRAWFRGGVSASANLDDPDLDAAFTYDHRIEPAPSQFPPEAPRVYRLDDAARLLPSGGQPHETPLKSLSGLTWDRPFQAPSGETPAFYHVWRQFLGEGDAPALSQPDDPSNFFQLTRPLPGNPPGGPGPVAIAQIHSTSGPPSQPRDWPPGLRYLDTVSRYGWYSYRLSSVDVFGRHSPVSPPAQWWQHGFFTHGLPPTELHSFAINIVGETAPPPPTGVEAQVLDPADSYIRHDMAMATWRDTLPDDRRDALVGLRVGWRWTQGQMQQAPDTTHFQICYHPDRLNVLTGRITRVDTHGTDHVFVTTDISISESPWHLKGAYLRVGQHSYRIVRSYQEHSDPLCIRVATLGTDRLRPHAGQPFALSLTKDLGSVFYTDYSEPAAWDDADVHRVPVDAFTGEELEPMSDAAGQPLGGAGASAHGVFLTLPAGVDLSRVRAGFDHIHLPDALGRKYVRIVQIRPPQHLGNGPELWLAEEPELSVPSARWEIGAYERIYEVLLPEPTNADAFDLRLAPSATDPIAYGHVGVTAHSERDQTSPVSAPAKIYRVHRDPPAPPPAPGDVADTENVYATAADYHGRSYHQVTWQALAGHSTHVLRALDDAVFKRDRILRETRGGLDPDGTPRHRAYFPADMSASRRMAVADQLNGIASTSDYAALDVDGLRVLRRLPGNETVVVPDDAALQKRRSELEARDWQLRQTHDHVDPNDDVIPQAWDVADRQAVASALNALDSSSTDAYGNLSNRALQVLASLPGHAAAFTQVTTRPVTAPGDTYRDTLHGRARNRYFYRVAYVDTGQNRSSLSPSGPPIYLPNVTLPPVPHVTKHACADGEIMLMWTSLREPELVAYDIYRTDEADRARDRRLMTRVHTAKMDETKSPLEHTTHLSWTDSHVHGGITYYYQLVARNLGGSVSRPSPAYAVTAVDQRPPEPAMWIEAGWVVLNGQNDTEEPWPQSGKFPPTSRAAVKLIWKGLVGGESFLISRQGVGEHTWTPITTTNNYEQLATGHLRTYDHDASPQRSYAYRVGTIAPTGLAPIRYRVIAVAPSD